MSKRNSKSKITRAEVVEFFPHDPSLGPVSCYEAFIDRLMAVPNLDWDWLRLVRLQFPSPPHGVDGMMN